jgi:hypothetical protein
MIECPSFFGSKVIDLLECISDCEKNITVNIDEGGWCYIKGEYEMRGAFKIFMPSRAIELEPMTVKRHILFQNMLFDFARFRYDYTDMLTKGEMRGIDLRELIDVVFSADDFRDLNRKVYGDLTFKVDLKCRKELAPVELLLELPKEHSYNYDDNEDENASGAHTVQDPSPDLELKLHLKVERCWWYPFVGEYNFLIRQWYTARGPCGCVGTSHSPTDYSFGHTNN